MTPRLAPALLAAVLAAGCGLDEYEKRMDEERVRLAAVFEQNKHLGDLLTPPYNATESDPTRQPALHLAGVFLRLPRGIERAHVEPPTRAKDGSVDLYRYPGPDGAKTFKGRNVFLAATLDAKMKADQFQHEVLNALRTYWANEARRPLHIPGPDEVKPEVVEVQPALTRLKKQPPLKFKVFSHSEPQTSPEACKFTAYFLQAEEGKQLAVIFQVPLNDPSADVPNERSLQTVGLGKMAGENATRFRELGRLTEIKK